LFYYNQSSFVFPKTEVVGKPLPRGALLKLLFFSGRCSITEVIEQRWWTCLEARLVSLQVLRDSGITLRPIPELRRCSKVCFAAAGREAARAGASRRKFARQPGFARGSRVINLPEEGYVKITIVIIDGMGGGIGVQLIAKLQEAWPKETLGREDAEILALGANAVATERMVKAGADRGASGENAVRISVSHGDYILGPVGIVVGNSMMGEITPAMAQAILDAPGERILLPLQQEHFHIAGLEQMPLARMVEKAVDLFKERLKRREVP
jgi:hypothetical protein